MKGDFTRSSFQPAKRYSGVRMQQGRVQLDADWNEQIDIVGYQIRTPLADILGPRATSAMPLSDDEHRGFAIILPASDGADSVDTANDDEQPPELPDFSIGSGRGYVDGLLCENEADTAFSMQPDFPGAVEQLRSMRAAGHTDLLVYLDVWTRHMTALEDPDLRELALDGPDTTTRTKTVWQVKLAPYSGADDDATTATMPNSATTPRGMLNVQLADYRMRENQLYRVEIQRVEDDHLFFKWSRENGSVAYPISLPDEDDGALRTEKGPVRFRLLDHDPSNLHLAQDDWVEFVSDSITLANAPQPLLQVTDIQLDTGVVTVQAKADDFYFDVGQGEGEDDWPPDAAALAANHAYLRRWDQRDLPAEYLFSVDSQFVNELDQGALPGPLRAEFQSQDRPLSGEATVHVEEAGSKWKIVDASTAYLIKNENQTLNVYSAENVIGCIRVRLNADKPDKFMPLESGLSVQFASEGSYGVGDYWMIPTRVQFSGDDPGLLWPTDADHGYLPQPPQGAERRAAPLARLQLIDGTWTCQPWAEADFASLPAVTTGLRDVTARVTDVEEDVIDLQQRVTALEQKLEKVLAWMKIERTMLFDDLYAEEQLTVGEVVALDPQQHDFIVRADTHQERVFLGVVADFPMAYHPDPDRYRYRVVISGRATCQVVGEVKPGALLVPSDYPGRAIAAGLFIRPGTVIGRALTGFTPTDANKIGEVNVLINMG